MTFFSSTDASVTAQLSDVVDVTNDTILCLHISKFTASLCKSHAHCVLSAKYMIDTRNTINKINIWYSKGCNWTGSQFLASSGVFNGFICFAVGIMFISFANIFWRHSERFDTVCCLYRRQTKINKELSQIFVGRHKVGGRNFKQVLACTTVNFRVNNAKPSLIRIYMSHKMKFWLAYMYM